MTLNNGHELNKAKEIWSTDTGRWPDAPQAFLKMKAALGVQLAEELFTGFGIRVDASEEYLDAFADGFVFRLFLCSER